jgi:hypothetical protein
VQYVNKISQQYSGGAEAYSVDERIERAAQSIDPLALSAEEERAVRAVLAALRRIRHGSVQIVVQDSRVVQIDTVEKQRFSK